jgi:hypothetical protein
VSAERADVLTRQAVCMRASRARCAAMASSSAAHGGSCMVSASQRCAGVRRRNQRRRASPSGVRGGAARPGRGGHSLARSYTPRHATSESTSCADVCGVDDARGMAAAVKAPTRRRGVASRDEARSVGGRFLAPAQHLSTVARSPPRARPPLRAAMTQA